MALTNFNVELEVNYGLDYTKGVKTIGTEFPTGSDAARVALARAKWPWFIGYCTGTGPGGITRTPTPGAPLWTDAQVLQCSFTTASHADAVWATGGAIGQDWYYGALPLSRANLIYPHGSYYVNNPCPLNFGSYIGQGSSQSAPDQNNPLSQVTGGTAIRLWHEPIGGVGGWIDLPNNDAGPLKYCFQSINYPVSVGGTLYAGLLGASGAGATNVLEAYYMEGLKVRGFRFDGRKSAAPEAVNSGNDYVTTYTDGGVVIWRAGSDSLVESCVADNFNNSGFQFASGVPGCIKNCRAFDCNYAGLWLRGDATLTVVNFECDECPIVYKCEGFPDPSNPSSDLLTPGCTLTAIGTKVETGTSGVASRYKGTMLLDAKGWVRAGLHGVGYASANIFPEILCRVEPYPTGFTSTQSWVMLTGLKTFGYFRTLMHHVQGAGGADSRKWFMDRGEYTVKYDSTVGGFIYNSANGGSLTTITGDAPNMKDINYSNLQNFFTGVLGTWNDSGATGTPARTNPPSPPL